VKLYNYHDSAVRLEREKKGHDHCQSQGSVYELSKIVEDGLAIDPMDQSRLLDSKASGTIIYAVNDQLTVHIGFDGVRGQADAVKHETLFHNANVRAAGEVQFRRGKVSAVNDHSGSYGTYGKLVLDADFRDAVRTGFERSGILIQKNVLMTTLKP
jgi:hypothetical protein